MEGSNLFTYVIFALIILFTVKNFIQLKRLTHERKFTESYAKVLKDEEGALDAVLAYIETEKSIDYKNEAYLVEAYQEMKMGMDPYKAIDSVDIGAIISGKNGYSDTMMNNHSDLFVWLDLIIAEARNKSMIDIIETLYTKVTAFEEHLNNRLEYVEFKACVDILLEKKGEEREFLKKILDGDYAGMSHDKRLIGLYKRIASSYLAYAGETFDEFFEEDLHSFATSSVGKHLMESLDILSKYPPKVEEPVEEPKEETEEVKEIETKEETEEVKEEAEEVKEEPKQE